MNILNLIVISMIAEAVWETLKMIWEKGKLNFDRIGALAIGLILAIATGLDMFLLLGIDTIIPHIGTVLTGILISRGANFMHDLISAVNNIQRNTKVSIQNNDRIPK